MLLSPAEYYRQTKHQDRYVRRVMGEFDSAISAGQRKRIAKCEQRGLFFMRSTVQDCYPVIADNRARKGRPYSMSLNDWLILDTDPDTVYCFAVAPGTIAAAMCTRVEPHTLYVQAWGDRDGQEKLSPVAFLCRGIYHWCAENDIDLLDIGTAPNHPSLVEFKLRLGFHLANA